MLRLKRPKLIAGKNLCKYVRSKKRARDHVTYMVGYEVY